MDTRFRSSDAAGVELPWHTVDDILDALEDGRLDAEDYVFDAARQAWQPIRKHSELVEAWERRMSYRPVEARRPITGAKRAAEGFPALSPEGITPVSSPAVSRIDAARRRNPPQLEEIAAVRRAFAAGEIGAVLLILAAFTAGLLLMVRALVRLVQIWTPGP